MADPVAFEFETAKQLLRLLKKSKDGVFNSEVDDSIPLDHAPAFIWAYVPATVTCTYDATVKAWIIGGATTCYPINSGVDAAGLMQWGKNDTNGLVTGGITCTTFTPKLTSTQAAPTIGKGFYLGTIFGYDGAEKPRVLIGLPPESSSSGSASIELVSDVICTPTGIEVQTVQLSGKDYDTAIIRQFLGLSDVIPVSYSGQQNRYLKVNSSATGIEFGLTNDAEVDVTEVKNDIITIKANIASIQSSITSLTNRVSSLEGTLTSILNTMYGLQSSVSTLNTKANNFESRITALENP